MCISPTSRKHETPWGAVLLAGSIGLLAAGMPSNASTPVDSQVVNMLWRHQTATNVFETTDSEALIASTDPCIFYLPAYQYTEFSTVDPIYLLVYGSDYLDSIYTSEGSYTYDTSNGYGYIDQILGTNVVARQLDSTNGLYTMVRPGESVANYTGAIQSSGLYGYQNGDANGNNLVSLSSGGITIQSNKLAGGALWSWTWDGVQFLSNTWDYGREMQADIGVNNYSDVSGVYNINPTEAGNSNTVYTLAANQKQGSPCYECVNSGTTQSTRCVPLDWNLDTTPAYTTYNPVIWPCYSLGKDITLNYDGLGAVAQYTTDVTIPNPYFSGSPGNPPSIEIPTAYLGSTFTNFYTYDAGLKVLAHVYPTANSGSPMVVTPLSGYGGAIISDGTHAMGFYGATTAVGGSMTEAVVYLFNGGGSTYNTSKFSAIYTGGIGEGASTFNICIMNGTVAQCESYMNSLYSKGYKGAPVIQD